jgi:hypothetical protein
MEDITKFLTSTELQAWIILLVPILYIMLETMKRSGGIPARWIPFVNAVLSLFAGGGAALLERQDLKEAAIQVLLIFLATAGVHDRLKGLVGGWFGEKPEQG